VSTVYLNTIEYSELTCHHSCHQPR